MIIEYSEIYDEEISDLFTELQNHISALDKEGYNIVSDNYGQYYLENVLQEVRNCNGKILLYQNNEKIVGVVVGLIQNDEEKTYDFQVPRRGRITELVVSSECRSQGIGKKLLKAMENYLKSMECQAILLGVFAYNLKAIKFYEENGYHARMYDMIKL